MQLPFKSAERYCFVKNYAVIIKYFPVKRCKMAGGKPAIITG